MVRAITGALVKSFSGLISRLHSTQAECVATSLNLARHIAQKSPVAVQGTKVNLVYARDHTIQDGLDFVVLFLAFLLCEVINAGGTGSENDSLNLFFFSKFLFIFLARNTSSENGSLRKNRTRLF